MVGYKLVALIYTKTYKLPVSLCNLRSDKKEVTKLTYDN